MEEIMHCALVSCAASEFHVSGKLHHTCHNQKLDDISWYVQLIHFCNYVLVYCICCKWLVFSYTCTYLHFFPQWAHHNFPFSEFLVCTSKLWKDVDYDAGTLQPPHFSVFLQWIVCILRASFEENLSFHKVQTIWPISSFLLFVVILYLRCVRIFREAQALNSLHQHDSVVHDLYQMISTLEKMYREWKNVKCNKRVLSNISRD